MAGEKSGLQKQDVEKATKQIKQIEELIAFLIKLGLEIPAPLPIALKKLRQALETGKMIADAADEAGEELAKVEKDLNDLCKQLDSDSQGACEADVARKYQARNVKYVLDPGLDKSAISLFIKKAVQKATPGIACKHWKYCSKEAE